MLHPPMAIGAKSVEAQAVLGRVYLGHQPSPQHLPSCRVDLTLEHRVLHPLAKIQQTGPGHAAQAAAARESVLTS